MKTYFFAIIFLLPSLLSAQIILSESSDHKRLFVFEQEGDNMEFRDSLILWSFFQDISWRADKRQLFFSYSMVGTDSKIAIYLNTYMLNKREPVKLTGSYWINQENAPVLFEHGLKLKLTEKGILLELQDAEISSFLFPYDGFNFERVMKFLELLSSYITK